MKTSIAERADAKEALDWHESQPKRYPPQAPSLPASVWSAPPLTPEAQAERELEIDSGEIPF